MNIYQCMARLNSKCKLCRREGEKLYLRGERCFGTKCALIKRNYKPGVHGQSAQRQKITDYGKQLRSKQSAKRLYGLSERQFANYVAKAMKKRENTAEMLINFLESRLDNVIYRLGLVASRAAARQFVGHNFVKINDRKVNIPSYIIKAGDIIAINQVKINKKLINEVRERVRSKEAPVWLHLDKQKLEAKVISKPELAQGEKQIDLKSIIEFYSR